MKLLYVDCGHPNLSADDCTTWSELGLEWYSTGYYSKENGVGTLPKLKTFYSNKDYYNELMKLSINIKSDSFLEQRYKTFTGTNINYKWIFSKDFCRQFDIFIFSHSIDNIINNIDNIGDRPIIFKTFGMHEEKDEFLIKHLLMQKKIIRVSNTECEKNRPNYAGENAVITGGIIPNEEIINGWTGKNKQICTFTNGFSNGYSLDNKRREQYIRIRQSINLKNNYPFFLCGANNENEPLSIGFVNFDEKLSIMRNSRVHLVTGTPNSSMTYSLGESMMMGCPVVCYGKKMWQSNIYLANKWFNHGEDILIGENIDECATYINILLDDNNNDLCQTLATNARKKALKLYGRQIICEKWKQLFKEIGLNI